MGVLPAPRVSPYCPQGVTVPFRDYWWVPLPPGWSLSPPCCYRLFRGMLRGPLPPPGLAPAAPGMLSCVGGAEGPSCPQGSFPVAPVVSQCLGGHWGSLPAPEQVLLSRSWWGARLRVPPAPQVQTSLSLGLPRPLTSRTVPVVPGGVSRGPWGWRGRTLRCWALTCRFHQLPANLQPRPRHSLPARGTAAAVQVSGRAGSSSACFVSVCPVCGRGGGQGCICLRLLRGAELFVSVVPSWAAPAAPPFAPVEFLLLAGLSSALRPPHSPGEPGASILPGAGQGRGSVAC